MKWYNSFPSWLFPRYNSFAFVHCMCVLSLSVAGCFSMRRMLQLTSVYSWLVGHLNSSTSELISWLVSEYLWGYKFYFGYLWVESLGRVETCHIISHLCWYGTLTHLNSVWGFQFFPFMWFQWSIIAILVTEVPSLSAPSFLSGPIYVHSCLLSEQFQSSKTLLWKCPHVDVSFVEWVAYMMMMCYCMTAFESMTLNCLSANTPRGRSWISIC